MTKNRLGLIIILTMAFFLAACANEAAPAETTDSTSSETQADEVDSTEVAGESDDGESTEKDAGEMATLTGKMNLSESSGRIGDEIGIQATDLNPNEDLTVVYVDMEGRYDLKDDNYSFVGTLFDKVEREVATGTADEDGNWEGEFSIPEGFGDDHDVIIYQNDESIAKANLFVETVFSIEPEEGPVGTEIEITGEALSWKMFGSVWHANYDNSYTGMITAVSTNGSAKAVIRAAGNVGPHTITIEDGPFGAPFLSRSDSAINYISTQYFTFNITDDEPDVEELVYIEEPPEPAGGGIVLPEPENKDGVSISIDKEMGTVGEDVEMKGSGLPANADVSFDWHTMVGNRVTPGGFTEEVWELGEVKTDDNGDFTYPFEVPDDLGGLPHLIDVKVDDEVVGQTYLRILPSIVSIEPEEGPPGTMVTIEIKGSGWTEFDNALSVTYDNNFTGYICGFNSQGTIRLPFVASGDPGYHVVDIYPSIYQGKMIKPDIYTKPQLTYRDDHPGTGIPAMRTLFKVTEE